MSSATSSSVEIGLHAVVLAVSEDRPLVLTMPNENGALAALPFGPFQPGTHKTLDEGLRSWVQAQTKLNLGYVEQLYTFGDTGRMSGGTANANLVSVGYLALVRLSEPHAASVSGTWASWYRFLPWEDWRATMPPLLQESILPTLSHWVAQNPAHVSGSTGLDRQARFNLAFGTGQWDEERVLERYELMYEAGLVQEALTDGAVSALLVETPLGQPMVHDHRRILATALARLRGKLKYRPIVFELMGEQFTLTQLQKTVETLSGQTMHKQNFRRMVEKADLVEPTGETTAQTGGRPAAYFRFRRAIMRERPAPGLRVGMRN
ncbi:MAG: NAD regulator [Pseudomonadota bacterium]